MIETRTRLTITAAIMTITIVGIGGMTLAIPLLSLRMAGAGFGQLHRPQFGGRGPDFDLMRPARPAFGPRHRHTPLAVDRAARRRLRADRLFALTDAANIGSMPPPAEPPRPGDGPLLTVPVQRLCRGTGPARPDRQRWAPAFRAWGDPVPVCHFSGRPCRHAAPAIDGEAANSSLAFLTRAPIATLAALIFGAIEAGGMALLPVYGLRNGHDYRQAAFLVSFFSLGNILFQIPLGLVSDFVDRRKILLVIALIGIIGAG